MDLIQEMHILGFHQNTKIFLTEFTMQTLNW